MILIIKVSQTHSPWHYPKMHLTVPIFIHFSIVYHTWKVSHCADRHQSIHSTYNRFTLIEPTDLIPDSGAMGIQVLGTRWWSEFRPLHLLPISWKGVMKVVDETATVNDVYDSEDNTNTIYSLILHLIPEEVDACIPLHRNTHAQFEWVWFSKRSIIDA